MAQRKRNRFKKLVHYVCDLCDDPTKLGAVKLNKVLWYVDTFSYRLWGNTVSGEKAYIKRQFGPVPKKILQTLQSLEDDGAILIRETEYFGKPKREYIALKEAKEDSFNEQEKNLIKQVVEAVCNGHTATSISDFSHDLIWEAAKLGDEIPIFAVLAAQPTSPTRADIRWADEIIKERSSIAA